MSAPPPPYVQPLYKGQVVYLRCVVTLPAKERYDDNTTAVLHMCDAFGKPFEDSYFYIAESKAIPRTKLERELK